jgi:signal transduction histidine kinase
MTVSLPLLATGYVAAGVLALFFVAYALLAGKQRVAHPFAGLMVALAVWSFGSLLRLYATTYVEWFAATALTYAGIACTPVALLVFALRYTGRQVERRHLATLGALSTGAYLLLFAEPVTGAFFGSVTQVAVGERLVYVGAEGPLFWVFALYEYALLVAASAVLVQGAFETARFHRLPALGTVFAVSIPWMANVAYVTSVFEVPVDPTPVAFVLGGALFVPATVSRRLVDITPIARSRVVDAIADAVVVLDVDGRVVDYNTTAAPLLGADAIGTPASVVLPDSLAAATGEPRRVAVDGRDRWFRRQDLPLDGSGTVVLLTDLTDQVRTQRRLNAQNRRLEQFASVAAHDLRNPINIIDGYVDLAIEHEDTSYLERVGPSIDRAQGLVDDLLSLGREGSVVADPETVRFDRVAREAWGVAVGDAATFQLDTVGTVRADRNRLEQLLEQLFDNAWRHGGENVTVHVGPLPDGFFVADDGAGIPAPMRDTLFEYEYSTHEGAGLGLPLVGSIAAAHGWDVTVTDSEWGGVRFELRNVDRPNDPERASATS